jgi:ATP/ADP translocase
MILAGATVGFLNQSQQVMTSNKKGTGMKMVITILAILAAVAAVCIWAIGMVGGRSER